MAPAAQAQLMAQANLPVESKPAYSAERIVFNQTPADLSAGVLLVTVLNLNIIVLHAFC